MQDKNNIPELQSPFEQLSELTARNGGTREGLRELWAMANIGTLNVS